MVDYEKYMYCTPVLKNHTIKKKNSWKMALPPDESQHVEPNVASCEGTFSKDETVLISVHCSSGTCLHEHISPLLGEHPGIVNIFWVP